MKGHLRLNMNSKNTSSTELCASTTLLRKGFVG